MNTLLERLRKIPARFLEFWNKYSPVQRILMIAVGVGVFLAIILVSYFVTRPVMTTLVKAEKTSETAKIKDLLDDKTLLAFRNMANCYVVDASEVNAYLVSVFSSVIVEKAALQTITKEG